MKLAIKNLSIYLYIFLISTSFISSIIEIPLYPIKVKGIPKYQNITISEPYDPYNDNNSFSFVEQGNTFINANKLFLAKIKIGSQGQTFNLILDTGSSILWVGRNTCEGKHTLIHTFNPSTSSTARNTGQYFSMKYGSGACNGFYYNDEIEYIQNKRFKMYFGVADTANFEVENCDGIIGLSKEYTDERLSFIHMLKKHGNTDSLVFSVKFENREFKPYVEGTMYIGEHSDFSKKEAVSVPMVFQTNKIFWACELSSFGIKNSEHYSHSDRETNIIFDTGTNFIILPMKYYQDIYLDLNKFGCGTLISDSGIQIFAGSGDSLPDFVFKFDRHNFTIPGKYAFYLNSNGIYVSTINFKTSGTFIIGSPFFFVFHTLFDANNDELKFYPLKNGVIQSGSRKLSTLAIVFIAIGGVVFIVGIILIIYFSVKKCKEKKNNKNIIPEDIGNIGEDYYGLYK